VEKLKEKSRESKNRTPESEAGFDLFSPSDFGKALRTKIGRPFVFGPIDFADLDSDSFDAQKSRAKV
jgi:hypothetical protein